MILQTFFTKMAITSPRKVQIQKFWCLKSSTNIWLSFGNLNSIQKVKNMELEQKEGSKLAKIGQILALKKLNLHFLKKFSRFDLTAFSCAFKCIKPIIIHWQSSLYRTGVVGGMHGWRDPWYWWLGEAKVIAKRWPNEGNTQCWMLICTAAQSAKIFVL